MMLRNDDGTRTAGPFDVLCILKNVTRGTFHAAIFVESPFPGPIPEVSETKIVRLKSQAHHTQGSETLEGALVHLDELAKKIEVLPENLWKEPLDWDGDLGVVWVLPNWHKPLQAAS